MGLIRCQIRLPYDSGLPRDAAVNTFYFNQTGTPDAFTGPQVFNLLKAFYNDVPTGQAGAVRQLLSPVLNGVIEVAMYHIPDPEPRVPFFEDEDSLTAVDTAPLPAEVAICVSFNGAPESGTPQARRRGRVFIGPLGQEVLSGSGSVARPDNDSIAILAAAATDLLEGATSDGRPWHVYSPTGSTSYAVVGGWVDNEFDTVRKRGIGATARTFFQLA